MGIKAAFLKKKGIKKKTIWLIVEQNILERERSIGAACEDGKLRCNCKLSVCPASSKELLRRKRKWKFNALRDLLRVYNISLLIYFYNCSPFWIPRPKLFSLSPRVILYHFTKISDNVGKSKTDRECPINKQYTIEIFHLMPHFAICHAHAICLALSLCQDILLDWPKAQRKSLWKKK